MNESSRPAMLYRLCLVAPAVLAILGVLLVALSRLTYPFALEWLEFGDATPTSFGYWQASRCTPLPVTTSSR